MKVLDRESGFASQRPFLEVEISKRGAGVKKQRTDAPHGIISLASANQPNGSPRLTELSLDGSVKFAMITFTSETGGTEQQIVPVPFSKTFYPKEQWIVGLVAQKTLITRV